MRQRRRRRIQLKTNGKNKNYTSTFLISNKLCRLTMDLCSVARKSCFLASLCGRVVLQLPNREELIKFRFFMGPIQSLSTAKVFGVKNTSFAFAQHHKSNTHILNTLTFVFFVRFKLQKKLEKLLKLSAYGLHATGCDVLRNIQLRNRQIQCET